MHQYIRPAAPPPTISPELLRDACRAYRQIDQAGLLPTLVEELAVARQEHRQAHRDHQWANRLGIDLQAHDLGRLLDLDTGIVRDVLQGEVVPSWTTTACREIVAFSKRLRCNRSGWFLLPAGGGR